MEHYTAAIYILSVETISDGLQQQLYYLHIAAGNVPQHIRNKLLLRRIGLVVVGEAAQEHHIGRIVKKLIGELMKETGTSQETLANYIGVTRQSVGYYAQGQSSPDWKGLVKIAEFFNVSLDYLMTDYEIKSESHGVRYVCEVTGLSEDSINNVFNIRNIAEMSGNKVLDLETENIGEAYAEGIKNEVSMFEVLDRVLASNAMVDYCRALARSDFELEGINERLTKLDDIDGGVDALVKARYDADIVRRSLRGIKMDISDEADKICDELFNLRALSARCEELSRKLNNAIYKG